MSTASPANFARTPDPQPRRKARRLARALLIGVVVLLVLLVTLALIVTASLRRALHANLPQLDGDIHIAGLTAPVTITRDAHAVPSITASNLDDLLFAQGYTTASDRLWQMDALRRHAAGELAEILGPSLIDHDRQQRYLQLRAAADRTIATLPADQLHQLNDYANGVNAWINTHSNALPVEFRALHYTPAPWTPRDTLLVALVMSQDLTTSFPQKLNREALTSRLPADLIADMYPVGSWRDHPPSQQPIDLTAPTDVPEIPLDNTQSSLRPTASPHDLLSTNTPLIHQSCDACRAGSNDWVIAASRSASGAPLLSNDMHLSLSAPDIWYEAALHTTDQSLEVTGFTLPGVPFILVGRNAHVAWGFTNTGADVQDVYIEHFRGSGNETQFEHPDHTWSPVAHHTEIIHVRAGHDVTLDVLTTTHAAGANTIQTPIISPIYKTERRPLSLAWNVYDPTTISMPLLAIDTAQDAASLVTAFSTFSTPSLNLVYADSQHIGYHLLGRIPIRGPAIQHPRTITPSLLEAPAASPLETDEDSDEDSASPPPAIATPTKPSANTPTTLAPVIDYTIGSPLSNVPVDSLDPNQQWSGYIPYGALPAVTDPTSGVLATANARVTPADYPYFITDDWVDPYRVELIYRLIGARTGLTPADMLRIQTDVHSDVDLVIAQRLAYAIDHASTTALHRDPKRLHEAANILRNWRGDLTPDSAAASITIATRAELWPMLLDAQLRAHGIASKQQLAELTALYTWGEKYTALEQLITHQPKRWLPSNYGSWSDLLAAAVDRAITHAPHDLSTWSYGRYHPVEIAHPILGSETLLSRILGIRTGSGVQPIGGDATTVKASGLHFGPSERFTADLSNPDTTFANITTGESGNPASAFYLDQFTPWLHGTTLPLPLNHPGIDHTLTLLPN
ncbi:penicillin acylase family protein [Granulicella sp. 5B5]|uniref:penicillin acylase family protein n=1 Tax=Granulicella sp. 5B5 TaxID=1617967 RepID=UPI0015F48A11|nr:penicillin acylase family protein [Granulicella sp. 5B5]QMV18107.1 penicillin acylase family protein [Granulicella sp. 5B5]